ncbi:MAG: integrase core domain-containing protein [Patescibacteria group bacterium]
MPYTTNPHLPRVRRAAVNFVLMGHSTRDAARHFGFAQGTIMKWMQRAPNNRRVLIPTCSSRPHHHPSELPSDVVYRILALRRERNQCAEILHHRLRGEGVRVSLSSVERIVRRYELQRFSKNKKWHQYPDRPVAKTPGILVQIDAVHKGAPSDRLSAYALIDVHSRWGHAAPALRVTSPASLRFVRKAQNMASFPFQTIQSDHGSEFSLWFTTMLARTGTFHRHSRVRTPTDNAHVERFIQTLQRECLHRIPRTWKSWERAIPEFLHYYNTERPHMALNMQTPADMLKVIPSY